MTEHGAGEPQVECFPCGTYIAATEWPRHMSVVHDADRTELRAELRAAPDFDLPEEKE